jgi:LacI family transcriptional regulator
MRDVAALAGVSVMTVSNVLNRPEIVRPPTRRRVLDAIEELGFVRNASARRLRSGRSSTIGLVLLDLSNAVFAVLARSVEDVASAAGLQVLLCATHGRPEREAARLEALVEQGVEGVLITPGDPASPQLAALRQRRIPVVLLDRPASGPDACSVSVDDGLGGRLAAEHVLSLGHERIAVVGGQQRSPHVQARLAAVHEVTGEEHLSVLSPDAITVAAGREAAALIVGMPAARRPTAAICANDLVAMGLLQEMLRHGVAVPDEFAIVGFDDIELAAAAAVPLTSVRRPWQELGRRATELLLDEARGTDHVHQQVLLRPTLAVRESSGAVQRARRTPA